MYLHATEKVLKDDNLLRLFDIPEVLWPRIRLSWQNRRHQMITGRLDFVWMNAVSKFMNIMRIPPLAIQKPV